jgi:hypothetical protein
LRAPTCLALIYASVRHIGLFSSNSGQRGSLSFLASIARLLSSYNIPQILGELDQDINATLQARGGFAQLVTFTADFIGGLTPLQFVDILRDYQLLSFMQDPQILADQQQAEQAATPR